MRYPACLIVFVTACGGSCPGSSAPPALDWSTLQVDHKAASPGCTDPLVDGCIEVTLSWPTWPALGHHPARVALDAWVIDQIYTFGEVKEPRTPEAFDAAVFAIAADPNPSGFPMSVERTVKVLHNGPTWVSLEAGAYEHTGGAHPNHATWLATFRTADGLEWRNDQLFRAESMAGLLAYAEERFRRARGLDAGTSLADEGFWFDDGFALPEGFAATPDGLRFHFSPYEIGPYAMGHTDFVLSYDKIRDWMTDEAQAAFTKKR